MIHVGAECGEVDFIYGCNEVGFQDRNPKPPVARVRETDGHFSLTKSALSGKGDGIEGKYTERSPPVTSLVRPLGRWRHFGPFKL
jgi:hypothetical protein